MTRFFIVTFVDLWNVGYRCSDVKMFDSHEEAYEYMRKKYIEACKNDDLDPFDLETYENEIGPNYAYIDGKYYWDIFNKDLNQD